MLDKRDIDFIAIDFETATPDMNSACSVGIAVVSNLQIAFTQHSFIRPPHNKYDPHNIQVHGITASDTENEKSAFEVLHPLACLMDSTIVVAHNAPFDMSVLHRSLGVENSEYDFVYVDTMDMVKPYDLPKRSLTACAEYFGIEMGCHHNALDDAVACAQVAIACMKDAGFDRIADFCMRTSGIKINRFSELIPQERVSFQKSKSFKKFEAPPIHLSPEGHVDENHPLYGKSVVFTGELSIDRKEAAQMAVNLGAKVKSCVSKKTDYLVVGVQDCSLVGDDGMSTKEEKAYALNESGAANIHIIREAEFLSLCGGDLCGATKSV